jgi:hypothetical protein
MTFNHRLLLGVFLLLLGPFALRAQTDSKVARPIMAGDRLRMNVVEASDMNRIYPVAGDGSLDLGLLGRVNVEGLTPDEASSRIESLLEARYFKKATVSLEVAEFVEGSLLVRWVLRAKFPSGAMRLSPWLKSSVAAAACFPRRTAKMSGSCAGNRVRGWSARSSMWM